ncbi:hypothetical protein PHJA_000265800 [Phtheirospermum japonicum]|uniref:S-protein homolog n=1 Tax=Phtheirospermum japonicum TaxID=374723 RepID=A0A830BB31_9LAMI|nr:hypothetical protein PHJA_000265800 [Phtheirospermum japonicum]
MKTTIIYIVLSFLLFASLFRETNSCFLYYKVHVNFYNNIHTSIPKPLFVHCRSKDDNLGNHTLALNQRWGFAFCVKPFSTLFKCELHWNGLYLNIVAYNALWLWNPCNKGDCTWTVNGNGAYLPKGDIKLWNKI